MEIFKSGNESIGGLPRAIGGLYNQDAWIRLQILLGFSGILGMAIVVLLNYQSNSKQSKIINPILFYNHPIANNQ